MRYLPLALLVACVLLADVATRRVSAQRATNESPERRPAEFAVIFNMGYAGDHLPRDRDSFEGLIRAVKQAHYNVVLCKYEDWRAEICRNHGVQIMADLLVPDSHVYKNLPGAKTLCEKLRGNRTVWGYHLWSDRIAATAAGRSRDIANVHQWDPTHSTYVGSYNARSLDGLTGPDVIGYYDFHWLRGGHWRHLSRALAAAKAADCPFLRYCQPDPGRVGVGNYNRVLYTLSTSIAFGLKGYTFHYGGGQIDADTWRWTPLGRDLARVNAELAPLGPELIKIGNPTAVFSTPVTRTAKDRPTDQDRPAVPGGLEPVPADNWVQVDDGELVLGVFRDDRGRDALFLANHNAYQTQNVRLRFAARPESVSLFNRKLGDWQELKTLQRTVELDVPPAAGQLLRVVR